MAGQCAVVVAAIDLLTGWKAMMEIKGLGLKYGEAIGWVLVDREKSMVEAVKELSREAKELKI